MQRTKGIDEMGENINQRMQSTARIVYVDDAKLDAEIERLAKGVETGHCSTQFALASLALFIFSRDEGAK